MKGLFITGTDTGVGKTFVTASLCRALRQRGVDAIALKPFATGVHAETRWQDDDGLILSAAMDYLLPPEVLSQVRLTSPLSPYDAARISGTTFDTDAILQVIRQLAGRHSYVLVEGVGGVMVPLTGTVMVRDFAASLGLPSLLVARSRIGTINHTLLSAASLRDAGVSLEGVVFNRPSTGEISLDEKVGPDTAARMGRLANFGMLDRIEEADNAATVDELINMLPVASPCIQALADHIIAPR